MDSKPEKIDQSTDFLNDMYYIIQILKNRIDLIMYKDREIKQKL